MADQEITVPMEDESLASLMADEPEQETVVEETAAAREERERDERGRFKAKAETVEQAQTQQPVAEPEQPQQTDDEQGGKVPSWRLKELREERDSFRANAEKAAQESYALRQQMAELQRQFEQSQKPKQEPVDFFQNPDEAFQQRVTPLEEKFTRLQSQMVLNTSRAIAVATHGAPLVKEMESAVDKASRENHPDMTLLAAQMRASDDPVEVAMQWYQRDKLLKETGGDLSAYKTKTLDEALNDPAFLARALEKARAAAGGQGKPPPNIQIPPSLNKATGAASVAADDEDVSDRGLFKHAMASGRR